MSNEETRTDLGAIRIYKKVISSIAAVAASEIEGVTRISTNFSNKIGELFSKRSGNAIKVDIEKNGQVNVEIPLVIAYDYNIPQVADKVQENVRNSIERMTNLTVKNIDINILGVDKEERGRKK